MRTSLLAYIVVVLLCIALAGPLAGVAAAGDAVGLIVEVPSNGEILAPGERIPVQVVGRDADGNRSRMQQRTVVLSASAGTTEVVRLPYRYAYTAPETVTEPVDVTLSAHLEETPDVKGSVTVRLMPPGPFARLELSCPVQMIGFGWSADVEIVGITASGTTTALDAGRALHVYVVSRGDEAGAIESTGPGKARYTAALPKDGARPGDKVEIRAWLVAHPQVKGTLTLEVVRRPDADPLPETPPQPQPQPQPQPPGPGTDPGGGDAGDGAGGTPPGAGDTGGTQPPADPPAEEPGLAWTDDVRLLAWRTQDGGDWTTEDLPPRPGRLTADAREQQIRALILADDVTDLSLEWWIGPRGDGSTVHTETAGEGRLVTAEDPAGRTVAILTSPVPARRPVTLLLILRTTSGATREARFTLAR